MLAEYDRLDIFIKGISCPCIKHRKLVNCDAFRPIGNLTNSSELFAPFSHQKKQTYNTYKIPSWQPGSFGQQRQAADEHEDQCQLQHF